MHLFVYINLTKMYHYMLTPFAVVTLDDEENVNITFRASGSNNQDGSHHQDMLVNFSVF